jgi:hypothetical protein
VVLPGDGFKVWELTAPLASLAVLLLVFVLVQTYSSWSGAGRAPTYRGALIRSEVIPLVGTRRQSIAGEQLIDRDAERATARQQRLGEARPTVPDALSWLMLAAVVMVLAVLGAATLNAVQPSVHLAIVLAAATAFAFTLILIQDLDLPYTGALTREPTQTEFVRDQIADELRGPLPCNSSGLPTGVEGFRASTAPLG